MDIFDKMDEALNYLNEVRAYFDLPRYDEFDPSLESSGIDEVDAALARYTKLYLSYFEE